MIGMRHGSKGISRRGKRTDNVKGHVGLDAVFNHSFEARSESSLLIATLVLGGDYQIMEGEIERGSRILRIPLNGALPFAIWLRCTATDNVLSCCRSR
jgi:hypothetical protein